MLNKKRSVKPVRADKAREIEFLKSQLLVLTLLQSAKEFRPLNEYTLNALENALLVCAQGIDSSLSRNPGFDALIESITPQFGVEN